MSLAFEAVVGGFSLATRRWPLVLADVAAKLAWLTATLAWLTATLAIATFLAATTLEGFVPPDTVPSELTSVFIAAHFSQVGPRLLRDALVGGFLSFVLWNVLEAFVRSRTLRAAMGSESGPGSTFVQFLASGVLRRIAIGLVGALVFLAIVGPGLPAGSGQWSRTSTDIQWSIWGGLILLILTGFFLMLVDTLMRCDAIETLGPHLDSVIAAVGTVGLFEVSVRMSMLMATVVMLAVAPVALVLMVILPVASVGLSLVHSYLLLVRYSAIGIIRSHLDQTTDTRNGPSHNC